MAIASTTEGEDKPLKYPYLFRACQLVVLSKLDLLPHLDFSPERFEAHVRRINPAAALLPVSATRGDGLQAWCDWLLARRDALGAH